jgi:hypothetical protein
MRIRVTSERWTFVAVMIVCCFAAGRLVAQGSSAAAAKPRDGDVIALPLPGDVMSAWEKAGASVGWLGSVRKYGMWQFNAKRETLDAATSVPAFKIHAWREGMLAKLPVPARAFGLDLSYSDVTDTGLKELAKLKRLTTLKLHDTKVTEAGRAELRKALPNLRN